MRRATIQKQCAFNCLRSIGTGMKCEQQLNKYNQMTRWFADVITLSCASKPPEHKSNESSYICVNRRLECPPRDTDESGFRETQPGSSFPVPVGSFAIHPNLTMRCKIPNTMIFPAALHLHQPWNHGCSHYIQSWRRFARDTRWPPISPEDRVRAARYGEQSQHCYQRVPAKDSFGDRLDRITE